MTDKIFKLVVNDDISDGYHTFDELYEHRCLLYISYVVSDGCPGEAYWIRDHCEGWDLLTVEIPSVGQISYHVPIKYRGAYYTVPEKAPEEYKWDGHTPQDVVARLLVHLGLSSEPPKDEEEGPK